MFIQHSTRKLHSPANDMITVRRCSVVASQGVTILLLAAVLGACSRSTTTLTTADRVKIVEEQQKSDPNFYLPRNTMGVREQASAKKVSPGLGSMLTVYVPAALGGTTRRSVAKYPLSKS